MGTTVVTKRCHGLLKMSPSRATVGSPLFQVVGSLEGCVSCFSGSQTPSFSTRSCCRLLRCLHPSLLQAVPVIVCCLQHTVPVTGLLIPFLLPFDSWSVLPPTGLHLSWHLSRIKHTSHGRQNKQISALYVLGASNQLVYAV